MLTAIARRISSNGAGVATSIHQSLHRMSAERANGPKFSWAQVPGPSSRPKFSLHIKGVVSGSDEVSRRSLRARALVHSATCAGAVERAPWWMSAKCRTRCKIDPPTQPSVGLRAPRDHEGGHCLRGGVAFTGGSTDETYALVRCTYHIGWGACGVPFLHPNWWRLLQE